MPCPCTSVQTNNYNFNVQEHIGIEEGYYGQTLEMLLVLREKILCLNKYSQSEERDLFLNYIQEMIDENKTYKYNIINFYNLTIYEECD